MKVCFVPLHSVEGAPRGCPVARANNCVRLPSCQKSPLLEQSVNLSEIKRKCWRSKDRNACQRAAHKCAEKYACGEVFSAETAES